MKHKCKIQNINYDWTDYSRTRLAKFNDLDEPWEVACSPSIYRTFSTQAEAISYATAQSPE